MSKWMKRLRKTVARNHLLHQLILEAAGEGIFGLDREGAITFVNPVAAGILGRRSEDLFGRPMHPLLHHSKPDGSPYPWAECPVRGTLNEGHVHQNIREVMWRHDGSCFPVELTSRPMWNDTGTLVGAVITFRDISQRVQAEQAAQEAEHRYRTLFEQSNAGIVLFDPETTLPVEFNEAACQTLGYSREEFARLKIADYEAQETPEAIRAHIAKLVRKGQDTFETRHRTKEGRILDVLVSVRLIELAGKTYVHAVFREITPFKQMERQARQLEQLAAMGQLLGGIAHEVKNPLFIMTGWLQLLRDKLARQEYDTLGNDLQKIEEASRRISVVTQRFLSFAKPHAPHREVCSVQAVVQETLDLLANELMKDHIQVVTALTPQLPPVWADRQQLREVFLNLMMNALQAMVEAHGQGTLTATTALVDREVQVRIQDNGPGIKPEDRARLFEPFFSTKPPGQGTGLGLWTVRSSLMEMGGSVTCETEVGRGTTFIVQLPVAGDRTLSGGTRMALSATQDLASLRAAR